MVSGAPRLADGGGGEEKEEERGGKQVVVVLVGPPGSGKSTFADAVVAGSNAGRRWVRICQVGPTPLLASMRASLLHGAGVVFIYLFRLRGFNFQGNVLLIAKTTHVHS